MGDLKFLVNHVHRKREASVHRKREAPPPRAAAADLSWLDWPLEALAEGSCHELPCGDSALELAMASNMATDGHFNGLPTEWAMPSQPGVDQPWF